MKQQLIISIALIGLLSSCYFVNDIFDPAQPAEQTLQQRSQIAVTNYVKEKMPGKYVPYGYGEITIHKPQELVEFEELEKQAASKNDPELDSIVAEQRRYLEANQIERTVSIEHFFTLRDSLLRLKVYEITFILNDTLGVKDKSATIMTEIPPLHEDALNYYFYEYNIFMTDSYYGSRQLSDNFYAFFKAEIERREGLVAKSAFLLHVLKLTHEVKSAGGFEQQEILEENVKVYMSDKRKDIRQYHSLEFSDLFQSAEEGKEEVNGYYFFHKFIGSYKNTLDTNVVLVEFSPYYEIGNIYQMDRPFDAYFK